MGILKVKTMNTAKQIKCMSKNTAKQSGFTLIEIMVVVTVIALLIGMIGPMVFNQVEKAERTRIAQDIRAIESALKFYRLDNHNVNSISERTLWELKVYQFLISFFLDLFGFIYFLS